MGWKDEEQKERLKQDLNEHLSHKRIIVINNELAGVYAVHITENGDLFINEISILKKYQNKGIGRKILEEQLKENQKNGIRTILQVFKDNPAKKLYEQLGFKVYGETETHYQMENIPYDKLIINASDKLKVCEDEGIELFIEDSYDTCKELTENGIKSILMTTKMNQQIEAGNIPRVHNWDEVYEQIKRVENHIGAMN